MATEATPDGALIRDGRLAEDDWRHLDDEAELPERAPITVSLERWQRDRDTLLAREGAVGVRVRGDQDERELAEILPHVALVVVEIAKFSDGRHFTLARLLRTRLGWQGELRARGDVLPDQLVYMQRCGFSSFTLRADQKSETALRLLSRFALSYQGSGPRPLPLFRRRDGRGAGDPAGGKGGRA